MEVNIAMLKKISYLLMIKWLLLLVVTGTFEQPASHSRRRHFQSAIP